MRYINKTTIEFLSVSENVGFARIVAAAFASQLEFTLPDLEELKVAISEIVANAIIHGYESDPDKVIRMELIIYPDRLEVMIEDKGKGIEDISRALKPQYTTDPERMGLGFAFVQSFMDYLKISSELGKGTRVHMIKKACSLACSNVASTSEH